MSNAVHRMTGHARTPSRIPIGLWVSVSAALHAMLVLASLAPRLPERVSAAPASPVWMEPVAPEPDPEPVPPPVAERPAQPARQKPATAPTPTKSTVMASAAVAEAKGPSAEGEPAPGFLSGEGTLEVGPAGAEVGQGGVASVGGVSSAEPGGSEPERKQGAAQLSLWMDPQALVRMALVRPTIALLMSVPGYRDALRGSGIRPFFDLQRLRIRLAGRSPAQLSVAGVHVGGEQALRTVAERVAAMRNRQPIWRGDAELRATSWIDGSGVDRGLAVHAGAFVIAARASMPSVLGAGGPTDRVEGMSRMRERVLMLLTIEDAVRYLPGLEACALQALRLSFDARGDRYRTALTAHYRAASFANRARSCLRAPGAGAGRLSMLVEWLARAESTPDSFSTRLQTEVTSDDIQRLLEELAWALRSA